VIQHVFVSHIIARYRVAEEPTQLECKQNRNGGIGFGPGLTGGGIKDHLKTSVMVIGTPHSNNQNFSLAACDLIIVLRNAAGIIVRLTRSPTTQRKRES
jgi:hypothetical protein